MCLRFEIYQNTFKLTKYIQDYSAVGSGPLSPAEANGSKNRSLMVVLTEHTSIIFCLCPTGLKCFVDCEQPEAIFMELAHYDTYSEN